jgi:arylsulfatase A-like enzyme
VRLQLLPALVLALILILTAALAPAQPPHILVILTDDLGWNDTSVDLGLPKDPKYNRHYRTPALERLAREGVRFSQAYATPVCTPSRVSLMTGLSVARHGVSNWTQRAGKDLGIKTAELILPAWNCDGLQPPQSETTHGFETAATLPALLRLAGYRTSHFGKAHFGAAGTLGADPLNLGFEHNVGGGAAGQPGSFLGTKNFSAGPGKAFWDVPHLEAYKGKSITVTQALTDEAILEIQRAKVSGKPFFIHFSHFGVHTPLEAAESFSKDYAPLNLPPKERTYATMVADVDASVGRILDTLDQLKLTEQTLVIFISDNGGFAQRLGSFAPHNAPLRSGKGSAYEGGLRVPCIVRWPGQAQAGLLSHQPIALIDMLPTLVAAGKGHVPTGLDGIDWAPALQDKPLPARDLLWYYPHVWGETGPGIEPFAALRRGPLKLITFFANGRNELYDVENDPGETRDLAALKPEEVARLRGDLLNALKASGRELPRPNR